ncbi:MAG: MFS transporter [Anaerolineae bacterium]|nr:MFS transporter [Anaerolineae bacterium]
MRLFRDVRRVLRKEVVAICAMVFMADVACGLLLTTFSLYARSLGASLALIGALVGVMGLTRILASVPIGLICDRLGRRSVISAGMLLFAISSLLHMVAPNPYFLFPLRVLDGLGIASVFFMGVAYIGDIVDKREQGLVIGLYTSCMGLGFTLGPLIGGQVSEAYGFRTSYLVAVVAALVGYAIARLGLVRQQPSERTTASRPVGSVLRKLRLVAKEPNLLTTSLANLLMSMVLFGTTFGFFPLYAASLSVGEATIGSMFAGRALISTSTRLPTGLLTAKFSSASLMLIALALAMTTAVAISFTTSVVLLGVFLAGDGIAYGVFLTSGQASMTEHSSASERGTALGLYSTAGSIGGAVAPFFMGVIADLWGLAAVFRVTGGLVLVGIGVLWSVSLRHRRAAIRLAGEECHAA